MTLGISFLSGTYSVVECSILTLGNPMNWPLVSVLFVTYKRIHLLERTLAAFSRHTDYPNLELVVADDGSSASVQEQIRRLKFDKYELAGKNRGMGANMNAGLAACRGEYIFVLQDDWDCQGPSKWLQQAVAVMEQNPRLGLLKYYGVKHNTTGFPLPGCKTTCLRISPEPDSRESSNVYSDAPHICSRAFQEFIGPYREDVPMDECELDYIARVDRQDQYFGALFPAYYNRLFVHTGDEDSFRTTTLRFRMEQSLLPLANGLKRHGGPAFRISKSLYRGVTRTLVRIGVMK